MYPCKQACGGPLRAHLSLAYGPPAGYQLRAPEKLAKHCPLSAGPAWAALT